MGSALLQRIGAPFAVSGGSGNSTITSNTLATAGQGVAMGYRFDCTGTSDTITHVGYRQGTTAGTPSANSYEVWIQGVDGTGAPDGTDIGGGSPTLAQFTPVSTDANKFVWVQLANSVVVNRDDIICPTIDCVTTDAVNNIQAARQHQLISAIRMNGPYGFQKTAGSWAKIGNAAPALAVKSSSAVYGFPIQTASTGNTWGNTTEGGMWFNVPTNFCSTYKIVAVEIYAATSGAGADTIYCTIYSNALSGSIAIQQQSNGWDCDQLGGAASNSVVRFTFDNAYTLPALTSGVDYVVGFATTGAAEGTLNYLAVTAAGDCDAFAGGQQFAYTSRTISYPPDGADANNFAAVTATQRPYCDLILADLTAPAGGGGTAGMLYRPNLAGT